MMLVFNDQCGDEYAGDEEGDDGCAAMFSDYNFMVEVMNYNGIGWNEAAQR
jgi:hypothetical protein